jgi:hypothetical protein
MIKKIALSSFASVLLLSQVANAEIKLGSFGSLTFNAGYTSNYVWRGIEQNNGNGTASKLLSDPAMYIQLQSTIKSVNTLVDDFKVHPKRYISVSVFGKKDKRTPLTKPLSDTLDHE